jgi:hypothetical protein
MTWDIAYHSGMSSASDLRACIDTGAAVGVVAGLLTNSQIFLALPSYLAAGGKVFVDSGAFTAFRKNAAMDWGRVFQTYDALTSASDGSPNLSIVAPDIVGDQAGTVLLWKEHHEQIASWINSGVRVIVPLQTGEVPASELLAIAIRVLGSDRFCVGIPSNLAAMSAPEVGDIKHHDFHILGRVALNQEVQDKVDAIKATNPDANLTADANWLRSRIAKVRTASHGKSTTLLHSKRTRAVMEVLSTEMHTAGRAAV